MKSRPKILIVDDDRDFSMVLEIRILDSHPAAVIRTMDDGKKALSEISRWKPDLLIVDMVIPWLDGLKVIQAIRGNPACGGIKILAVSGLVDGIGSRALQAGADAFFRKAAGMDELIGALPEYLPALKPSLDGSPG